MEIYISAGFMSNYSQIVTAILCGGKRFLFSLFFFLMIQIRRFLSAEDLARTSWLLAEISQY